MSIQILQQTDTTFQHEKIHFSRIGVTLDFGPAGAKNDPTGLIAAPGSLGGPNAEVRDADRVFHQTNTNSAREEYVALAAIMVNVVPHFDNENYNVASRNCITFTRMAGSEAENVLFLLRTPGMSGFINPDIMELADQLQNNPQLLQQMMERLPNNPSHPNYYNRRADADVEPEVLTAQQPAITEPAATTDFAALLNGIDLSGLEAISFNSGHDYDVRDVAPPVLNVAQDISRNNEFQIG